MDLCRLFVAQLLMLLLGAVSPVLASTVHGDETSILLKQADMLMQMKQYSKAASLLEVLAEENGQAACKLAGLYEHGLGTEVSAMKARTLYVHAAMIDPHRKKHPVRVASHLPLSDIDSQMLLASHYETAGNSKRRYKKAFAIYQRLAARNMPDAMNELGLLYQNGLGVEKNEAKAVELFQKAAESGLPNAMNNLGYMYFNGFGVTRDFSLAKEWFEKASQSNEPSALANLGWMYLNGQGAERDFAKAINLFGLSSANGSLLARKNLGYMLEYGLGIARDEGASNKLYEIANEITPTLDRKNVMTFAGKRHLAARSEKKTAH